MPDIEQCKCHGRPIHEIFPKWAKRARERVVRAMTSGRQRVPPIEQMRREATLVRALSEGRKGPLEPRYRTLGHLCDECPFRSRATNREA